MPHMYELRIYSRSALYCDFTHRRMVFSFRHFGTTYRYHLQGKSSFLGM